VPSSCVRPAGLKAMVEGSSARAITAPPRALPRALYSYRANPAAEAETVKANRQTRQAATDTRRRFMITPLFHVRQCVASRERTRARMHPSSVAPSGKIPARKQGRFPHNTADRQPFPCSRRTTLSHRGVLSLACWQCSGHARLSSSNQKTCGVIIGTLSLRQPPRRGFAQKSGVKT